MSAKQWEGKTGGGKFGQNFLFAVLRSVPVRVMYIALYLVTPFYVLFDFKSRKNVYRYYRRRQGFSAWKSFWRVFANYLVFGKVVLDKFAIMAENTRQFKIVEVENIEHFDRLLNSESGFVLASAHVGNFELVGHCLLQDKKRVNGIIFGGESSQMRQQREKSSEHSNIRLISVNDSISHVFAVKEALDGGEIVTELCDRMFGSEKGFKVPFLGADALFPAGTFRMAVQLEKPILALFIMKDGGTRYRGFLYPLVADKEASPMQQATDLAAQFARHLETVLRRYPNQWFNYYDFWNTQTVKTN
ncbi:MAG: lysophospholipid acyltransferase family protein [Bacteroidales bacterium]|nr:lysophospholipid acyltransferase family protein [Bacteroidales bacterium]